MMYHESVSVLVRHIKNKSSQKNTILMADMLVQDKNKNRLDWLLVMTQIQLQER